MMPTEYDFGAHPPQNGPHYHRADGAAGEQRSSGDNRPAAGYHGNDEKHELEQANVRHDKLAKAIAAFIVKAAIDDAGLQADEHL